MLNESEFETISIVVSTAIKQAITPIRDRLDALESKGPDVDLSAIEARMAAIEKSGNGLELQVLGERLDKLATDLSGWKYCGVWQAKETYERNNFCTHAGSLWIATEPSVGSRPGEQNLSWQLCCKKGKDA